MKLNSHIPRLSGRTRHVLSLLILLMALFSAFRVAGQMAMPDMVCVGATKHYWADPTPGSTYTWQINGVTQTSTTNEIFITWDSPYTPAGSPYTLSVQEKSVIGCYGEVKTGLVYVNPVLSVSVSFTAGQNPACSGVPVTFTATPINGGITPVYEWRVNGVIVGMSSPAFTYIPNNADVVNCILTSNAPCATGNPATSNPVTMTVHPVPYVDLNIFNNITTRDAKPFKLKGGILPDGVYSGAGVTGNFFNPALLPPSEDTAVITYTRTNIFGCSNAIQRIITVYPSIPFICGNIITDVRDSISYSTVQIGSQCWLAANLNYGQQLNASANQRDNCLAEKYCYNDNPVNCTNQGALYQWDELMQYDDTVAIQGLCPPEWHVPDEPEWNTLFAFYQGNAFAGDSLRTGGTSGFNALLTGGSFMNKKWTLDTSAFFWSSSSHGPFKAWAHSLNNINHGVSIYPSSRSNAFSIRCIKD